MVLSHLMPIPSVQILGVADNNPEAVAIKMAQAAGLPVFFTNPIDILGTLDVDIVFDLTGDPEIRATLLQLSENRFEVATGQVTRLFINTIIEAAEKNQLLKKHLEISLLLAQSKTHEQVFDAIVSGGMEITDMPVGSLAIFDKENGTFTLLSQKGLPPGLTLRTSYPVRHGGLSQYILSVNEPVVISDLTTCSMFDATTLLNEGLRSLVAIPLFSEREILGILYFDDLKPRSYPADLVDILSQFATEAVIAIQKQKAVTQVRRLSSRDNLTGLYNRNQLVLQLREATLMAEKDNETLALLICDLDRFKEINETLGHHYGDKVLKVTAETISAALLNEEKGAERPPILFRSGVDEIAVILFNIPSDQVMEKAVLIRKVVQASSQKVYFPLDISIGGALYPEQSQSADQLIILAGRSLLIAQREEEKVCIGATEALHDASRIGMIFEPVVDIIEGQIIGYEALGRDVRGKVSITDLFKKYAEWGQLSELKSACFVSQLKKAYEMGLSQVFLNVDSILLDQCEWIQKPPGIEVVLEISESESLQDVDRYLALAEKWRSHGFKFAIDDFGAGFISLPFISKLNPDYIKIDRSVILQATASAEFRIFMKNLVSALQGETTHQMIAEGIETETELQIMRDMDIRLVQGFLLRDMGYFSPTQPKDLHAV